LIIQIFQLRISYFHKNNDKIIYLEHKVLIMKENQIIKEARKTALKKLSSKLYKIFGYRSISVIEYFSGIIDPRHEQGKRHSLLSIIVIAICGVICGADGWAQIEEFGKDRQAWFETFLDLPHGMPIEDTYRRVFAMLDPKEFQKRFSKWIQATVYVKSGTVIAIDGKTMRGCKGEGVTPKHIINAWSSANRVTLGQCTVNEKSNEITAIPELLKQLCISGCIITIDAMGCQTKIASLIKDRGGNYLLALKGNQGTLEEDVDLYFRGELFGKKLKYEQTTLQSSEEIIEKSHGRIEIRKCWVSTDIEWLSQKKNWKDIKSLIRIESERIIKGKSSKEVRYYISSLEATPDIFLEAVRSHWGVESMHWILDVAFSEDACRIREGNASENFNVLRHTALHLLNRETSCKRGVKTKRFKAACNIEYLEKILMPTEEAA
jgi:predicted transposase YbfD/YdcC